MNWSWRAYVSLLVLASACCSVSCQRTQAPSTLTVSREEIRSGDSYNVTCRWDAAAVSPEHIQIQSAPRGSQTSHRTATDTTVVNSVDSAAVGEWQYECMQDGRTLMGLYVRVGARLQVEDFECRINLYDATMMTNCSFSKPNGVKRDGDNVSFYLKEEKLPPVQCTDYPHNASRILCRIDPGALPKAIFEPSHSYTLIMSDSVGNQTQHFIRTKDQVRVLDWPNKEQPLTPLGNYSCLIWQNSKWLEHYEQEGSIEWQVRVIPLNDAIAETVISPNETSCDDKSRTRETFCVNMPPYPNQQFELRLRRRFSLPEAPWSEMITRQFWVAKSIPSRPPRLLPNGFYLDPRSKGLYIFWEQLKALEHNAPNLTYSLTTSDGKQASPVGRNFAIFPHWDDARDSTISVCSENSEGRSLNCSDLYVPVLENAEERQPQALKYDKATHTLSWTAPEMSSGLLHYTVYWCSPVNDTQKICDDSQAVELLKLDDASRLEHRFDRSMELINLGVAATYQDKLDSGGMKWLRVGLPTGADLGKSRYLEGIVALIVLCLIFISYRKLHRCSGIEIEFPNGVYDDVGGLGRTGVAEDDDTDDTKDPSQDTNPNNPKKSGSVIELAVIEHPKEPTKPIPEPSTPLPVTVKPWIALAATMPGMVLTDETTRMYPTESTTGAIENAIDDTTPPRAGPIQIRNETDAEKMMTSTDGYFCMTTIMPPRSLECESGSGTVSRGASGIECVKIKLNDEQPNGNGYVMAPSFR